MTIMIIINTNPCAAELFRNIIHLKLKLLTQFPAPNDVKILISMQKYTSSKCNY